MNTSLSLWQREQSESYDPRIEAVLLKLGFEDQSWHNDVTASFAFQTTLENGKAGVLRVWVHPERVTARETLGDARFQVDQLDEYGNEVLPSKYFEDPLTLFWAIIELLRNRTAVPRDPPILEALKRELTAYCIREQLPQICAEEILVLHADLTDGQKNYLVNFVKRWTMAEAALVLTPG